MDLVLSIERTWPLWVPRPHGIVAVPRVKAASDGAAVTRRRIMRLA